MKFEEVIRVRKHIKEDVATKPTKKESRDAAHLAYLHKVAAEADSGDVVTLTGLTREQKMAALFGDA